MSEPVREVTAYEITEETRIYVEQREGGRMLYIHLGGSEEEFYWLDDSVPLVLSAPHARLNPPNGPSIKEMYDFWKEHHPP